MAENLRSALHFPTGSTVFCGVIRHKHSGYHEMGYTL